MIPVAFDYVRPATLREAVKLMGAGDGAKLLAGGHSLLPMMRFRLAQPPRLVDISRLEELRGVQEFKKGVRIGACTTYAELARSPLLQERCPLVAEVAGEIADIQVRNRGTIGGSLAHADPASDMPAVMLALDATFVMQSRRGGKRTVPAREFFTGAFSTALAEDELFTDILLGGMGRRAAAYVSFDQAASGYALVGCCVSLARKRATISELTVAYTGLGDAAFIAGGFESVIGTKGDLAAVELAARGAVAGLEVVGDLHAPAEYRRHLAAVAARRAVEQAYQRAG